MSKSAERFISDVRTLQQLVTAMSHADTLEQACAFGLSAIQEILKPDRAFVLLAHEDQNGSVADLVIPIALDGEGAGQFVLQFDHPSNFTETDFALAELAAAQTGQALAQIRDRERVKETTRHKNESVAMAVHELRSPLTAIIGATFLLRSEKERERGIEMIKRNAKAQEWLIEDLLKLSQLDAGRVELRLSVLDLVPVIVQVVEDIRPSASANGVTVDAQLPAPIMVRGDARRLWEIFWNLLSNSLRFSSGGGRINVTAQNGDRSATICVSDDGCGISPDRLPFIFDRFEQAHEPRTQRYDGLGLGLAIAKEFVSMHGGSISAKSAGSGQGASFTIQFPLAS